MRKLLNRQRTTLALSECGSKAPAFISERQLALFHLRVLYAIQRHFRLRKTYFAGHFSIGRRGRLRSARTPTLRNAKRPTGECFGKRAVARFGSGASPPGALLQRFDKSSIIKRIDAFTRQSVLFMSICSTSRAGQGEDYSSSSSS